MSQIHNALFLLLEQRVQPPRLVLSTVGTQDGDHAERRLRTFVDDDYRQVVGHRQRRGIGYRNCAHFRLHILVALESTSRYRPESMHYLLRVQEPKEERTSAEAASAVTF